MPWFIDNTTLKAPTPFYGAYSRSTLPNYTYYNGPFNSRYEAYEYMKDQMNFNPYTHWGISRNAERAGY